ncbi:GerAB/ArcD/ProY family transporter [Pseudobacteroides cellulosolvens]|uniref:Spore germination protein n=1 Tax=Pseudobacteroides cellulosolvens ATCC 35603 = DSM 2933 TaxID=398512 RepID=A0A0L6JL19_9FIRM|nr:endospore germination permease [Pseudobacteroides cellulosolvens]KNY26082.1 spore germination protein [Pseudobacteroides cellulosolvens ATCC 35603 = DSM 2933]
MIREGKIGLQESVSLIAITIGVKVYFTSPAYIARLLGTSSWYATIISAAVTLVGFTILCMLLKRYPGEDLIGAFEKSLGRVIGFVFSIVIAIFLFIMTALILREFAEVLKVYSLPLTPPSFVIGMLLAAASIVCFLGLESIARAARLFAIFLLAGFLVVIVMAWNNYDIKNLFPMMGNGLDKTIINGIMRSSFYGEVIVLGIIASSLQGLSQLKKSGYISIIISGLIASLSLLASMMAFSYATSQEITSRMYELARIIQIGGFFQRLDPFFLFTWCIGTMVSISFLLYCTISTYCKSFRIQDMRPVIIPSAVILFSISMMPDDFIEVIGYVNILRQHSWTIFFGLPLITLIISIIRKKKGVQKNA